MNYKKHLVADNAKVIDALEQLNVLGSDAILFVITENGQLKGSLTDGDVRRGLIKGMTVNDVVNDFIQQNPKFIFKNNYNIYDLIEFKKSGIKIIPVLDEDNVIINVINFRIQHSYLPIDAVIMAGGRGERLKPLTNDTPKPLLIVGEKPIIEHNLDNLIKYGIDDFHISVRYLGEQIEQYLSNGDNKGVNIQYLWEVNPLGTIGAISTIKELKNDYILVTNSDLLTDLNYEDFFLNFVKQDADLAVATIPYHVSVPYAVLELNDNNIVSLKEKPLYTYFSNGGIYLMKKEILEYVPENTFFNATDLLEKLIELNKKVISFPLIGYWLDIGQHDEYKKAQEDIKHLKF